MAIDVESETKEKLVSAGLVLFRRNGVAAVTLADVAKEAGFSRQTVYLNFGNRAGLLTEVARHNDLTSTHAKKLRETSQGPASVAALETFVKTWFRNLPEILDLALALDAAGNADATARAALNNRMDTLATMVGRIVQGLEKQERLNPRWKAKEATDWICLHLDPQVWNRWVVTRKWPPQAFVTRVWQALRRELLEEV